METQLIKTFFVEVVQTGSAALALATAEAQASEYYPGSRVVASRFTHVDPFHAPGKRRVGIEVDLELTVIAD